MILQKLYLTVFVFFFFFNSFGQNSYEKSDDDARIVLSTFIPEDILEDAPSARKLFATKLDQITSSNGLGGSSPNENNRFIISGDLNILTKDILPTAPPKYAVTIQTNIVIGDGIDGKSFASEFIEFKGVGVSEDKAFIAAIKKINPRHPLVQELIENGKQKIIEYYNAECDFITKEANTLANSRNFDEAIFILTQVPKITKDCYDSSMDFASEIMRKKFEFECQTKISEARALITNGEFSEASTLLSFYTKDMECYKDVALLIEQINIGQCSKYIGEARAHWANRNSNSAAQSLARVNASSPCYEESIEISSSIAEFLDEKESREWNLSVEKYKDELAIKNRVMDNEALRIKAIRDVGVAFGKNQPRNITYKSIF